MSYETVNRDQTITRSSECKRYFTEITKKITNEEINDFMNEYNLSKIEAMLFHILLEVKSINEDMDIVKDELFDIRQCTDYFLEKEDFE